MRNEQPATRGKQHFKCDVCNEDTDIKRYTSYYNGYQEEAHELRFTTHGIMMYEKRNYRVFTECSHCGRRGVHWC